MSVVPNLDSKGRLYTDDDGIIPRVIAHTPSRPPGAGQATRCATRLVGP